MWFILITSGLSILIATFIAYTVLKHRLSRNGAPLPCPPRSLILRNIPLMADAMKKGMHIDLLWKGISEQLGSKIFFVDVIFFKLVVILDVDMAKEVLVTKNYPKSFTYDSFYSLIGGKKSILVSGGNLWHEQRMVFNPGFHYQYLKNLVPIFASNTERLVSILDKRCVTQEVVSMHLLLTKLTMDIICEVVLGVTFNVLTEEEGRTSELYSSFKELMDNILWFFKRQGIEWTRDYLPWNALTMYRLETRYNNILIPIIKQRMAELEAEPALGSPAPSRKGSWVGGGLGEDPMFRSLPSFGSDHLSLDGSLGTLAGNSDKDMCVLSVALRTAREKGIKMELDTVLAQVKTFFLAGHDTTATTVSWAIYELAHNKEAEEKMVAEINQVCGGRIPTSDDLSQLTYTGCVVREALRMWPPGGTTRIAPVGATLKGYDIGGHPLYIPHYCLHRDPQLWGEDADEFKPERWLDEDKLQKMNPFAYQPFSKGKRNCIGQTFAVLEARTLLAMLYSKFTFQYAGSEPERQVHNVTSHPKDGVLMRVVSRAGMSQ